MIKISLKGLAKFMTGTSTQQRKVLKDYKYPDPEGKAQAIYYREARDYIATYHKKNHDPDWLAERASELQSIANQSYGQTKTRYANNARALRQYFKHFSKKKFTIMGDKKFSYNHKGVSITVIPDLHVNEQGTEKIIKLEFTKDEPDTKAVRIITQLLFEAQLGAGMSLPSSCVLCFDIPRGKSHKGARVGARLRGEIEAACENVVAIWNTI